MSVTETLAARVDALCGDLSSIRAPRGTELHARPWSTAAPLRMLLNNLDREVAEKPEELIVYGGSGRAARNHEALLFLSMVASSTVPARSMPQMPRCSVDSVAVIPQGCNRNARAAVQPRLVEL